MISRGNPLFSRTFPRLINTIFLSLFCAKRPFYPVSRKIATHYFARNDIFSIFATEIILFSCKFHQTIILFSCEFHQTIILFSCKECIYQTYFREVYNEKENLRSKVLNRRSTLLNVHSKLLNTHSILLNEDFP